MSRQQRELPEPHNTLRATLERYFATRIEQAMQSGKPLDAPTVGQVLRFLELGTPAPAPPKESSPVLPSPSEILARRGIKLPVFPSPEEEERAVYGDNPE